MINLLTPHKKKTLSTRSFQTYIYRNVASTLHRTGWKTYCFVLTFVISVITEDHFDDR